MAKVTKVTKAVGHVKEMDALARLQARFERELDDLRKSRDEELQLLIRRGEIEAKFEAQKRTLFKQYEEEARKLNLTNGVQKNGSKKTPQKASRS